MNGAFESTGRFVCSTYEQATGSLPDACLDGTGLLWLGGFTIGIIVIVAIVIVWRVFL